MTNDGVTGTTRSVTRQVPGSDHALLAGGGAMGAAMRATDWSTTAIGPVFAWPQSLKTAVRIVLNSRYPMFVWWGPQLVNFYNDAYTPILGKRHPRALGRPAREIWQDIWADIGPLADAVVQRGESTWNERFLLIMERNGYPEETYFTFSYSPAPDDEGGIGGLFCACSEETDRVIGERRLRLLRHMSSATAEARSIEAVCSAASGVLRQHPYDVSFALVYLLDADGRRATLAATAGIAPGDRVAPESVELSNGSSSGHPWPLAGVLEGRNEIVDGLDAAAGLPGGVWPERAKAAMVLPLTKGGQDRPLGFLIAGASPRRPLDESYQGFFELLASAIAASVANAASHEEERRLLGELVAGRSRLADVIQQSPAFVAVLNGPQHVFELANERYFQLVGHRDILGKPVRIALPEVEGQGYIDLLDRVYTTGEPFIGRETAVFIERERGQPPAERILEFVFQPLRNPDGSVSGIFVHGVDLTEHKMAEAALRHSDQQTRLLTDALPALISYVGPDHRYRFNNRAYEDWFGAPHKQITGKHLREIIGEKTYEERLGYMSAALRGETVCFEAPMRHQTLGLRHTEVNYVPNVVDGQVMGFVVLVHDITDRRRATDRISRLHEVAAALSEALTTDEVANVAVEQGIAALGATAGSLSLVSEDGESLEMMGHVGYSPEVIDRWKRFPLSAPIPLADAVRTASPIYLDSPEERLRRYPALAAVRAMKETSSSICLPLIVGGKAVGVLALSFDRHGTSFSTDDREFVLSLGRQCAQALERARLFEAERIARAEAERASRAKDEFLAILSHELRTPLTPVLLTVSLIERHPGLPEELREDVAAIRRNVELESRLISDLLDLTRIARGKLQLDAQDVDLHLILRSAIDICQREASAKLAVELRATHHTVRGDATRLEQIFWNLISNAQKFTGPDGTITVRSSDAGEDRIRVEVSDTGVGIDPAVMPKLFSAFEQGEVRSARQQAGLGLGLAISKSLAEAHGGTITARSGGRGRGSTFVVELPSMRVFTPLASPQRSGPMLKPAVRSLNVLLVEDNVPTLTVMSKLLRLLGHRVTGATTVASASAAARQQRFDLLLSDLGLPDGSGLDLMRELQGAYAGRSIALTGYGMDADILASRDAGFAEHLTKPVDLGQLEDAIRRVSSTTA